MKQLLPLMICMSAYRPERSPEQNWEKHLHFLLALTLDARPHCPAIGQYKGVREQSVCLFPERLHKLGMCWLARRFDQECFLIRYPDGSCYLCSASDGTEKYIGQWRELSREAAAGQDHTEVGGRYYAAV